MANKALINTLLGFIGYEVGPPAPAAKQIGKPLAKAAGQKPASSKPVTAKGPVKPPTAKVPAAAAAGGTVLPPRTAPKSATANVQGRNQAPVTPPGMAGVMSTKRRKPNDEELRGLRRFTGRVLSAPDMTSGVLFDEEERQVCAMLDNGEFLREVNEPFSQTIMAALQKVKTANVPITGEWLVESSVIRQVYDEAKRRAPKTASSGPLTTQQDGIVTEISPQQRVLLDIIEQANDLRATDIRVLIRAQEATVWMRVGGALRKIREYRAPDMRATFSAIYSLLSDVKGTYDRKLITQAILTKERVPFLPDRVQGLRMQFMPSGREGSFLAARMITEEAGEVIDIDKLGWSKTHLKQFKALRRKPWGVFYITGPTGAGKSTTAKVSMEATAVESGGEASILTAEDPSEYSMGHDIIQFSMTGASNTKDRIENYTSMIMALLRADPDIIFVGEVREDQSSALVMKSAETGHGTWTTMHTNNTIAIFPRLRGMGGKDYDIFNHQLVVAAVAQRLVREVCPHCSWRWDNVDLKDLQRERYARMFESYPGLLANVRFRNESGCTAEAKTAHKQSCTNGYSGRTLLGEIMITDEVLMKHAKENEEGKALRHWEEHCEGVSMAEHGWYKVVKGLCDPGDVEAAIGDLDVVDRKRYPIIVDRSDNDDASIADLEALGLAKLKALGLAGIVLQPHDQQAMAAV